jgi:hypothetical protein
VGTRHGTSTVTTNVATSAAVVDRAVVDGEVAGGWSWRWTSWASWPVTPAALALSALCVGVDIVSAWLGEPPWYLGRILISPALPLALALVAAVGISRLGGSRRSIAAWREFLVVTGIAITFGAYSYAQTFAGWREVEGVALTAAGEEVIYRLAAVLLIGAVCARLAGRDWRDTAQWGTGPMVCALVGAGFVFSALPGHVAQMAGPASMVPFASLAVLLGYVTLRTGSLLPAIAVHALLDLVTLSFFAGSISDSTRLVIAGVLLASVAVAMMPAGRRLGMRRRVPTVIDLRIGDGDNVTLDHLAV